MSRPRFSKDYRTYGEWLNDQPRIRIKVAERNDGGRKMSWGTFSKKYRTFGEWLKAQSRIRKIEAIR